MGPVLDSAEISRIYCQRLYIGFRSALHVFSFRDQKVPWVYSHGRWPNLKRDEYTFLMLLRTSSWICHTITFADNPLVKITHMAKSNINGWRGGGLYSVQKSRCCKIIWQRCGNIILLMGNGVLVGSNNFILSYVHKKDMYAALFTVAETGNNQNVYQPQNR